MRSNFGAAEDSWEQEDIKKIKSVNPKGQQP